MTIPTRSVLEVNAHASRDMMRDVYRVIYGGEYNSVGWAAYQHLDGRLIIVRGDSLRAISTAHYPADMEFQVHYATDLFEIMDEDREILLQVDLSQLMDVR